ncbi:hypothetical protein YC2023_121812 [Brassica napus]
MLDLADLCLLLLGRRIGWLRSLRLMFGGRGLFGRVHALHLLDWCYDVVGNSFIDSVVVALKSVVVYQTCISVYDSALVFLCQLVGKVSFLGPSYGFVVQPRGSFKISFGEASMLRICDVHWFASYEFSGLLVKGMWSMCSIVMVLE